MLCIEIRKPRPSGPPPDEGLLYTEPADHFSISNTESEVTTNGAAPGWQGISMGGMWTSHSREALVRTLSGGGFPEVASGPSGWYEIGRGW